MATRGLRREVRTPPGLLIVVRKPEAPDLVVFPVAAGFFPEPEEEGVVSGFGGWESCLYAPG